MEGDLFLLQLSWRTPVKSNPDVPPPTSWPGPQPERPGPCGTEPSGPRLGRLEPGGLSLRSIGPNPVLGQEESVPKWPEPEAGWAVCDS